MEVTMAKLIFLLKRKPGMSKEGFRAHYEASHVKLAEQYIGHLLTGYHRNYPVFASLNPSNQPAGEEVLPYDFGYDAVTEMRVKDDASLAEINRIFNDPAIQPILMADELRFLDRPSTVMLVCEETQSVLGNPAVRG
jgi:hypothetical protein